MFFKKVNIKTMDDLRKILLFVPPVFISFLSVCIMFATILALEYKNKNEIYKLEQESKYVTGQILNTYVTTVKNKANTIFHDTEENSKISVSKIVGYLEAEKFDSKSFNNKKFKKYIKSLEMSTNSNVLIFNTKTFEIFYGDKLIDSLYKLSHSKIKNAKFNKYLLKNFHAFGDEHFQYFLDKDNEEIILSYFSDIKSEDIFVGVFSNVNEIKNEIKKIIFETILVQSKSFNGHFWFYDYENNFVFNYNNEPKVLSFEMKDNLLNNSQSENIYKFSKYKFLLAMNYNEFENQSKLLKKELHRTEILFLSSIITVTIIIVLFLLLFSRYISNIFIVFSKNYDLRNQKYKLLQERHELAVIASNDGLWDIDLIENKIFFSQKWLSMFGYKKNDLVTYNDWFNIIHDGDKEKVQNSFNEHIKGNTEHFIAEYRLKDVSGTYKWVLTRGKVFRDNDKATRMIMMSMDMENRKELTKKLNDIETLVETGRLIICKLANDKNLSIKYVSKSIESYGYSNLKTEKNNKYFLNLIYKDDQKNFVKLINDAINKNMNSFSATYRIVENCGKITWVYSRIVLLKDYEGKVNNLYGYINDINKIKISEEELRLKVEKELEINREKDRILINQNKLASMGEMLGSIAHQWRQPLNNISLLIHFIRDGYIDKTFSKEQLDDSIDTVKLQIEYMSRTIDDFRNFYEPNKEKITFDVKKSILQASKIVRTSLEKCDLLLEIEGDDVLITSYENELEQVIVNILNNAADAACEKREKEDFSAFVNVNVKKDNDTVIIKLKNNCGILENNILEKIFDPYFTTKFEKQGTGIGLYMSKIIIEKNMNGKIEAKNVENGMTFEIILPI